MIIKNTDNLEIHSFYDIPSVMVAATRLLIEKKDKKNYVIIIIKNGEELNE